MIITIINYSSYYISCNINNNMIIVQYFGDYYAKFKRI